VKRFATHAFHGIMAGKRRVLLAFAFVGLLASASCDGTTLIAPSGIGVEAEYALGGCLSHGQPQSTCFMFTSGGTVVVADSAKLMLQRDRSATLVLAQTWTRYGVNCPTGGPCPAVSKGIITLGGTYSFRRDSMIFVPDTYQNTTNPPFTLIDNQYDLPFTGMIPVGVSEAWPGPDSLTLVVGQDRAVVLERP
jgi:hypothetical protein